MSKKVLWKRKGFSERKSLLFIILEQESERWVVFPVLPLTFSVVLDKSQMPCCSELSIKSKQSDFWGAVV